jgi:hypothetical protein
MREQAWAKADLRRSQATESRGLAVLSLLARAKSRIWPGR